MAESFIFSIAESLTTKIASRAYEEASQVVGVYDVLQDLKSSLSYVKAVLLDAEQKQEQNHELREWLKQIKLIFYDAENLLDQVDCETLRKRVVRDYGTPKDKILPRSISKLKHLRYLSLRDNGRVKKLPASICNLQNLEELNLSGCVELQTLPEKLRNLINLRRISITTKQFVLPEDDLANLCLLEHLHIYECDNLESTFVGVKLPTLRFLWIMRCKNLKSLPLDKHHFPQLEQFVVDECVKFELSDGHEDMNSVLRLKTLFFCMMVNFPPSLHGYANTLQTLVFLRCYELEALPEWLLNMTSLKFLHIWSCPRLLSLPSGIHCLKALEVLRIERCPRLYRKYQPHVGEYWHQISHIKHIQILQ
ncbi:hypothetical protein Ahy_B06g080254 isoform D [Arachis hypogaea]|uniref:Uncharacterized protein n=1 Tax=Arachis hypogaea TaxID=3818 RepID=A0A444YHG9_ARAHY|nr:hypothetical protein Ahy_B06g080254 isoform D [Arachis hypogaea]